MPRLHLLITRMLRNHLRNRVLPLLAHSYIVTDYITKSALKTHTIFQAVKSVFAKMYSDLDDMKADIGSRTRTAFVRVVNALTAQSEIGAPMAAMYLLEHPDHYTSHTLKTCYSYPYLKEVSKVWEDESDQAQPPLTHAPPNKVMLMKKEKTYMGVSPLHDYI